MIARLTSVRGFGDITLRRGVLHPVRGSYRPQIAYRRPLSTSARCLDAPRTEEQSKGKDSENEKRGFTAFFK